MTLRDLMIFNMSTLLKLIEESVVEILSTELGRTLLLIHLEAKNALK